MGWLIGLFIVIVVLFLLIILFIFKKSPNTQSVGSSVKHIDLSLEELIEIVKTEYNDISKIENTLDQIEHRFPFPEREAEANEHFKYVYFYAKNPLTTAKMIVKMQKRLAAVNPKYERQIENFQMVGVEARKK